MACSTDSAEQKRALDMIIRVEKRGRYVVMEKAALETDSLSLRARGLYALLMTLPDDWHVNIGWLYKHAPEGRDAIRSAMRELESHGYAELVETRDDKGRLQGSEWVIREAPDDRAPEKPVLGKSARSDSSNSNKNNETPERLKTRNSVTERLKNRNSENPTVGKSDTTDYTKELNTQRSEKTRAREPEFQDQIECRERVGFAKPDDPDDCLKHCVERLGKIEGEKFFWHYEANGWMAGNNAVKDYRAALQKWKLNVGSFDRNGREPLPEGGTVISKSGKEVKYRIKHEPRYR